MAKWFLESLDVNGGYLPGLSLTLPQGLTCIIGPRGSGKSTVVEAIRFGVSGLQGASKARMDLVNGNLARASLTIRTLGEDGSARYVIRRALRQPPSLSTTDGRVLSADLDRGTLLPLDGYSSSEIEGIADELGEKRRVLLDELLGDELRKVQIAIADDQRALAANADRIRVARQTVHDLSEQIEELSDARVRLAALPAPQASGVAAELAAAARQQRLNKDEATKLVSVRSLLQTFNERLLELIGWSRTQRATAIAVQNSENSDLLCQVEQLLCSTLEKAETKVSSAIPCLAETKDELERIQASLQERHLVQHAILVRLQDANAAEGQVVSERAFAEQQVALLEQLEIRRDVATTELLQLLSERAELKAAYLGQRDQLSGLRERVALDLQHRIGGKVRLRVLRGADDLAYTQLLTDGLRGAGLRNHEGILEGLKRLRPEHLAQIIQTDDAEELEAQISLGTERTRKVLDAFREKIDPLELEVMPLDDRICIELNVGSSAEPIYKDASTLSRGQKCTALLPLLIARRDVPLVIDQPEDNLDNHFIYETVVDTISRAKNERQMIFITHNANIPVLAEADLVVVLNSDGNHGFVERQGNLIQCRDEIIDLLEGGREAFELRRLKYADS